MSKLEKSDKVIHSIVAKEISNRPRQFAPISSESRAYKFTWKLINDCIAKAAEDRHKSTVVTVKGNYVLTLYKSFIKTLSNLGYNVNVRYDKHSSYTYTTGKYVVGSKESEETSLLISWS